MAVGSGLKWCDADCGGDDVQNLGDGGYLGKLQAVGRVQLKYRRGSIVPECRGVRSNNLLCRKTNG